MSFTEGQSPASAPHCKRGDASTAKSIVMKWDGPMTGDWEGIWDRVQRAATSITF